MFFRKTKYERKKRVFEPALLSLFKLPPAEAFFVLNADCCANKKERDAAHAFFYAFATAPLFV